ncbi:hypothetical protein GMST_07000 [Geomonas silvestris]|uniref:Uncharacterized protein n=1 Tax=Geomonas silvestris TaxID=2740184 RepID=A0A6V8MEG4_9BACT|nr:hypothetical protein [Geomonas silvestris]GFO58375.1 hypothetical protein GMST_07000 [Geomonas silvestris]
MGIGMVWSVLRQAATRIPWSKVVQNAPLVVDVLDRVKLRTRAGEAAQRSLDDQLHALAEENARLSADLLRTTLQLKQLAARVSLLSKLSGFAIGFAAAALVLALVK